MAACTNSHTSTRGRTKKGSGGSISQSIGQIVYTSEQGSEGNITQGVQQTYQIEVLTGTNKTNEISFDLYAYPNPTTDFLTLEVGDLKGQLIIGRDIIHNSTKINTEQLPISTYLLKIIDGKNHLKTFKIIKK